MFKNKAMFGAVGIVLAVAAFYYGFWLLGAVLLAVAARDIYLKYGV